MEIAYSIKKKKNNSTTLKQHLNSFQNSQVVKDKYHNLTYKWNLINNTNK